MYATLFRHVLFPVYEGAILRRGTPRFQREYARSEWYDGDRLAELQLAKLNRLLAHAWAEVPFLGDLWRTAGLSRAPLRRRDELAAYPILTKQLITDHYDDMIARSWRGRTLSKTTGGSSGTPFRLEYTSESYARRNAIMWRGYGWAGCDVGTRAAYLWGVAHPHGRLAELKERLYQRAYNRRFFDAFRITEANVDEYIAGLEDYAPDVVVGYVAPVVLVARRLNRLGRRLHGLRSVITGAEALYEPERAEIARAFGCPVFNTYGCREFMLLASECPEHRGLHVNVDHVVLETVDDAGRPVHGTSGDVLVTDLHNYGMPFVRYRNGDRATWSDARCPCGRGLPLLASVDGRILDTIDTLDGRHVPGEFFVYAMLDLDTIQQYLVVQTAADAIELQVVKRGELTADERARIADKLHGVVGPRCRILVRQVDAIAPAPSGKRRVTVSLLHAGDRRNDAA
ncbi:MAG: phenylacetate--CoA ligase family protein [Acidobacteriota bacterium]